MNASLPFVEMKDVSHDLIAAQPSFVAALTLSESVSGLAVKEYVGKGGIVADPGTWSRVKSGEVNFPVAKYQQWRDIVQNDVLLFWLCDACGYERPKRKQSETERALAAEQAKLVAAQQEIAILRGLVTGRAV